MPCLADLTLQVEMLMFFVASTLFSEQGFAEVIGHGEIVNISCGRIDNVDMKSSCAQERDPPNVCLVLSIVPRSRMILTTSRMSETV